MEVLQGEGEPLGGGEGRGSWFPPFTLEKEDQGKPILGNEVPTEGAGNLPLRYLVHHVARKFRGKKNLSNALIKVF